jgi:hypothetical protein
MKLSATRANSFRRASLMLIVSDAGNGNSLSDASVYRAAVGDLGGHELGPACLKVLEPEALARLP